MNPTVGSALWLQFVHAFLWFVLGLFGCKLSATEVVFVRSLIVLYSGCLGFGLLLSGVDTPLRNVRSALI